MISIESAASSLLQSLLPETARSPRRAVSFVPRHLPAPRALEARRSVAERAATAPARHRSEIAASTRSAMRSGVKPISSCSSAGLPCVT